MVLAIKNYHQRGETIMAQGVLPIKKAGQDWADSQAVSQVEESVKSWITSRNCQAWIYR